MTNALLLRAVLGSTLLAAAAAMLAGVGPTSAFFHTSEDGLVSITSAGSFGTEPPPAPTGLTCTKDGGTGLLEWQPVEGATGYRVYHMAGEDGDPELYLEVDAPDTIAVISEQLGHYFVVATFIGDVEGEQSEPVGCTPGHDAETTSKGTTGETQLQGLAGPTLLGGSALAATPTPTASSTPEPTQSPEPTPEPKDALTSNAPEATPTPEGTATPEPTATPKATPSAAATAEATPEATSTPGATPEASATPEMSPTASGTETPEP